MTDKKYRLRYLPLFYSDLHMITDYLSRKLCNVKAAEDLIDHTETAILERLPVCEAFEQYLSRKERPYPYYRIYVNQYVVWYVVIEISENEKIMEVRRMLHTKQDSKKYI